MKTAFIIDKTGAYVSPNSIVNLDSAFNNESYTTNQVSFEYYNTLSDAQAQINPILSGVTGTLTVQARPTINAAWQAITNGTLDLSVPNVYNISNHGYAATIQALQFTGNNVAGCNYIRVTIYRS